MGPGEDLEFIADTFEVELCNGTKKLLGQCSPWEMLNLPVAVVLDIPDRLYAEYLITSAYLDTALTKYLVQYVGKDVLMKKWGIEYQPTVVVPSTKHYSWPKSGGKLSFFLLSLQGTESHASSVGRSRIRKCRRYWR